MFISDDNVESLLLFSPSPNLFSLLSLLLYIQLPAHWGVECLHYVRPNVENHNVRIPQYNREVTDHRLKFRFMLEPQQQEQNMKIGQNWASYGYRQRRIHKAGASHDPCRGDVRDAGRASWAVGGMSKLRGATQNGEDPRSRSRSVPERRAVELPELHWLLITSESCCSLVIAVFYLCIISLFKNFFLLPFSRMLAFFFPQSNWSCLWVHPIIPCFWIPCDFIENPLYLGL